jgi:hypothetical protein
MKLAIQRHQSIKKNDHKRTPKIRVLTNNVTIEAQLWQRKQHTTHLVEDIFQINIKLLSIHVI